MMFKTLRLAFKLRIAYSINSFLYSLKRVPLIKRLLPYDLYDNRLLKKAALLVVFLWEIASIFIGKGLYYYLFIYLPLGSLYHNFNSGLLFHILFCLSVIGMLINARIFEADKAAEYAINDFNLDAKNYILINFFYKIIRHLIGYMGLLWFIKGTFNLNLFYILIASLGLAAIKITAAYFWLLNKKLTENALLVKVNFATVIIILALTYGLPLTGLYLNEVITLALFSFFILTAVYIIPYIYNFKGYHLFAKRELYKFKKSLAGLTFFAKVQSEKEISSDTTITSDKKGFAYLNDLFVKRHYKLLYKAAFRQSLVMIIIFSFLALVLILNKQEAVSFNEAILNYLPYFVFIMYTLNRGESFAKCLFMNCDHSLLSYSFFKSPANLLKLFKIRLIELIKVNIIPAFVIAVGLMVLLYLSGGAMIFDYLIILITIISLSIFFSIHNLTLYYLIQPYNIETGVKSAMYGIINFITYIISFGFIYLRFSNLIFGILCTLFCVIYSFAACFLVYKYGSRTFKLH